MTQLAEVYITPEQYLEMEAKANHKSEYFQGRIFMMAGGTARHGQLSNNVGTVLNNALFDNPCYVYNSDVRIKVEANGLFTYADTAVVCGEVQFAEGRDDTITNPVLIAEVLSPSTRNYDRGDKFELYRGLESFQTYLIIDQARAYVEHHYLEDGIWKLETLTDLNDVLKITSMGIEVPLNRLYNKIKFSTRLVRPKRDRPTPHPNPGE